ncbi:porin, partial [Rhizobium johnstonii]
GLEYYTGPVYEAELTFDMTVDSQLVDNFYAQASVQYLAPEDGEDSTSGYFRLPLSF